MKNLFNAKKALEKAKIQLMLLPNTCFYTTILFSLKQVWTDKIYTAAVDGKNLFINPDWFTALSDPARVGLLAHEVDHVCLDHMSRCGNRDHRLWNEAGDYVINDLLTTAKYTLPAQALLDRRFKGMNTEQIYKVLYDEAPKDKNGKPIPTDIPGIGADIQYPKSKADASKIKQDVATIVSRAVTHAREAQQQPGTIPGEALIRLEEVINPKLPWHVILENYLTNFAKDDYTWQKPNRRYMPDFYLPTAHSEAVCNLAIAVDASASALKAFSYYVHEIASLKEIMNPDMITLITFDTRIQDIQEISNNTDLLNDVKFTGGGGTKIKPVLKWAKENNPDVLIVFTDGEFSQPYADRYPECPVIWIIDNDPHFTIPYGKVIHYDL